MSNANHSNIKEADNEREENFSPAPCADEKTLHANVGNDSGAESSITAPPKYIKPIRCAVDSLYLSFQGRIDRDVETDLSHLKSFARNKDINIRAKAVFPIGEHRFEVSPKGAGNFAYVLDDNWFRIQISGTNNTSLPLAYVQVKSELLTFHCLDEIIDDLTEVIKTFTKDPFKPNISRLDLCMDFCPQEGFDIEAIDIKQWKTRAVNIDRFHQSKRPTGWRIGKGDIMARLYNKTLEIKKSKKDYLKTLWSEKGWDGESDIWRLEFQFRQSFFASINGFPFQMSTAELIEFISPSFWHYAAEDWLQLVVPNQNDSNASRWPVHPAWEELLNNCTFGKAVAIQRVRKERLPEDDFLFINSLGFISSFMAREGITDMVEAISQFYHQADRYFQGYHDTSMENYLREKSNEKTKRYNTLRKE